MVILITGGAGFIGSALTSRLLADGHDVRVLDNLRHGEAHGRLPSDVEFIEADVRDVAAVKAAAGRGCDRIVHLASIAGVKSVSSTPIDTMAVGFDGANNVFRAALENNVEGVLCFSSSEVYGTHVGGIPEDAPTPIPPPSDRRWGYAAVKLATEHLARAYSYAHALPVVSFRIFNTYGPGQLGDSAVHNFVRAMKAGEPLIIRGDGASVRTWCYIDDTIEATVRVLERLPDLGGEVFNIGNPYTVRTTKELAEMVSYLGEHWAPMSRREVRCEYVEGGSDVRIRIPNIDKAKELLLWEPKIDLFEGLKRTIGYYLR